MQTTAPPDRKCASKSIMEACPKNEPNYFQTN